MLLYYFSQLHENIHLPRNEKFNEKQTNGFLGEKKIVIDSRKGNSSHSGNCHRFSSHSGSKPSCMGVLQSSFTWWSAVCAQVDVLCIKQYRASIILRVGHGHISANLWWSVVSCHWCSLYSVSTTGSTMHENHWKEDSMLSNAPCHKDLLGIENENPLGLVNLKPWSINWVIWFYGEFIFHKGQGKNPSYLNHL